MDISKKDWKLFREKLSGKAAYKTVKTTNKGGTITYTKKKAYVTQVRGIEEARIWDNFEEWFREKLQESAPKSLSPEAESMAYLEKHPDTVIICDEVGNGIVPLDSFEREYRERLGRLLCEIAAKAERVERIVCGIGQRIK